MWKEGKNMRNFSVHRSAVSRYMGRSSGNRSSIGRRSSYRTSNTSRFESYLLEAKKLSDEAKSSSSTEEEETAAKSSALSKYQRTKASTYKNKTSKYNDGVSAMSTASESFEKLLAKDDPDMDKAYDSAVKFADGYNDMFASVKNSSSSSVAYKAKYISSITSVYSRSLSEIGITSDKDGKLSVDKEKFMSADKDDIEKIFAKKGSFASHITEQTDSISLLSKLSADTYSSGSSYSYTSAAGGTLFSKKF